MTIGSNKPVVDLNSLFPGKLLPFENISFWTKHLSFSRVELTNTESSQQQGVIARFYGTNESVSILASSKSRTSVQRDKFPEENAPFSF